MDGEVIYEDEATETLVSNEEFLAADSDDEGEDEEDEEESFTLDDDVGSGPSGEPPLRFDLSERLLTEGAISVARALPSLPTRHDLIVATEKGLQTHQTCLRKLYDGQPMLFFPNDIHESLTYQRLQGAGWNTPAVQVYQLNIFGVLQDGSKAHVIIDDIPVYFDIWFPESAENFAFQMASRLQEFRLLKSETGEAYPLKGYRRDPCKYLRVHFSNLSDRKKAISEVRKLGHRTASDDLSNYFRMVARTYGFSLCSWDVITKYEYHRGGVACNCKPAAAVTKDPSAFPSYPQSTLASHVLKVPLANMRPLIDPLNPDPEVEKRVAKSTDLARDRSLVMTFDIETHSPEKGLGTPPDATKPNDVVFMLCASVHWRSDPKPLARVCLATQECAPDQRWITIICGPGGSPLSGANPAYGQDSLLIAFSLLFEAWAPEFVTGFNDGQYDWPFLVEKARQFKLLTEMEKHMSALPRKTSTEESLLKWQYSVDRPIKISAEKRHFVSFLKFPGYIPVDTRVSYMRLFAKAEKTSLKWFLGRVGLGGKADMPHTRMWRIYEEAVKAADAEDAYDIGLDTDETAEHMRHVAHYCIIDAVRCQELLTRRNVIGEQREVGNYSYTSMNDCFYFAGGHKVCNMLMAYGRASARLTGYPILGSMIAERMETVGKYPGAFVVPPEQGLEEDDPVTGLDFSSLYPSLMRAYNLSLDMWVESEQRARELEAEGETVYHDSFTYGGQTIHVRFVRHNNRDEKRGIFPRVLADLYAKREAMKVGLKLLEAQIEFAELALGDFRKAVPKGCKGFGEFLHKRVEEAAASAGKLEAEARAFAGPGDEKKRKKNEKAAQTIRTRVGEFEAFLKDLRPESADKACDEEPRDRAVFDAFHDRLEDLEFQFASVDSKQKAVKVFMNTFYGEAGNSNSPIFLLELAGGVTSAGQYNLKLVAEFVKKKGFHIKYGDTDSLYLTCPRHVYEEANAKYRRALAALGINPPTAEDEAFWDSESLKCKEAYAEKLEKFKKLVALLESMCPDLKVGSREFIEARPDLHSAYLQGLEAVKASKEECTARLSELGERPTPKNLRASNWLQDVFDRHPELEAPVRAAYEELCTEKITITMATMDKLKNEVNDYLESDNGSTILKMAYEEVLHPVVFTGKKKYFGIAHIYNPNYHISGPDKIFVRGIDVIKQGQTRLTREIGYRCMWEGTRLHPPGARTPYIERVEKVLRDSCTGVHSFRANDISEARDDSASSWKLEDFVQTDAWKPDKDNKSVKTFMRRMAARHRVQLAENELRVARGQKPKELDYVEPEAGSRFSYLIIDTGPSFDLRGYTKGTVTKGDLMEYEHVARKRNLPINVPYYLTHYVVGLCARFICYDERFHPPPVQAGSITIAEKDPKKIDEYSQKAAKSYLTKFIQNLTQGKKNTNLKRGHAYKRAYRQAAKQTQMALQAALGDESSFFLGGGDQSLVLDKAASQMNALERVERGIVNFELFLDGGEGENINERLLRAASSYATHVLEALEIPHPDYELAIVDSPNRSGAERDEATEYTLVPNCSRMQGVTARTMQMLGIDRSEAGRQRLYRNIEVLKPPSRRVLQRRRMANHEPPITVFNAEMAKIEREAYVGLQATTPSLIAMADRIRNALEELVMINRRAEKKKNPELREDNDEEETPGEDVNEVALKSVTESLRCTEHEIATVRMAQQHWLTLVGVQIARGTSRRLLDRMVHVRDRAL